MSAEDKSLLERVEIPNIPKDAQKKIAHLQEEFIRAEVEQLRKSVPLLQPLFKKRNEIISIPAVQNDFWVRVFSSAPAEIDEYILPSDAGALGTALKNLTVERFEVDAQGNGEPRSLRFTFDFQTGEENPFFENSQLVKEFYWRKQIIRTSKGKRRTWEGLVSEPVRINWKKDMDLTKGLLDAACDLAAAEKKKGGERTKLPEYEALVKKVAEAEAAAMEDDDEDMEDDEDEDPESPAGTSFFAFFGYRGRDVSAEVSKAANKEDDERYAKILKGEEVEDDDDEDDEDDDEEDELADDLEDAEIFPNGEELAISLAEDLWTDAMKYYVASFDLGDDLDLADLDMDEIEAMDEEEDSGEGEERPVKKARN